MAIETREQYCPICGRLVAEATYNRFGEWCCSDPHAEEYVAEVRSRKQQSSAGAEEAAGIQGRERHRGGCCR